MAKWRICPKCQRKNPHDANFCDQCCTPLRKFSKIIALERERREKVKSQKKPFPAQIMCPHCHTQQPDSAAFCDECGLRLS